MTGIPINVRCVLGEAQTTVNHPGMICRPLPPGRLDGNEKGRQGGKRPTKLGRVGEELNVRWERFPTQPNICTGDRSTYSTSRKFRWQVSSKAWFKHKDFLASYIFNNKKTKMLEFKGLNLFFSILITILDSNSFQCNVTYTQCSSVPSRKKFSSHGTRKCLRVFSKDSLSKQWPFFFYPTRK